MDASSKLINDAVDAMAQLPGVGRKTAMRYVLHLLKRPDSEVVAFTDRIAAMKEQIKHCKLCYNLSDAEICPICQDPRRDKSLVCVVQDIRDIMAIEATDQYKGLYHVLGGIISPMDGIGPNDLAIDPLIQRCSNGSITEVILALSATMEGETTGFFLFRKLEGIGVKVSAIARGVSVGDQLEYADEATLGRSIVQRTPFENSLSR